MVSRILRISGKLLVVFLFVMAADTILGAHVEVISKNIEILVDVVGGGIAALVFFLLLGRIFRR